MAVELSKPSLDVGIFTTNTEEMLAFYRDVVVSAPPNRSRLPGLAQYIHFVDVVLKSIAAHGMIAGMLSHPRTVEVGDSLASVRSTSHSGKRFKTSSNAIRPSSRASAEPRQ